MRDFFETVIQLDDNEDISGLLEFVQNTPHDLDEVLSVLWQLVTGMRIRPAFMLAMLLANRGYQHPIVSITLSAGGLFHGNRIEEARGLGALRAQVDKLSVEQQTDFRRLIVFPLTIKMLELAVDDSDYGSILRILEIYKAAVPSFRTIFDWDATVPELSLASLRRQGRERARIVTYPLPPVGTLRQKRRVLVTGRETFFLRPTSRIMDNGPRMVFAMNAYGWQAEFHALKEAGSTRECRGIVEMCRQKNPDILFLDDELLTGVKQARAEMITQLRRENPSLKVVGYLLDSWSKDPAALLESFALLDVVWEGTAPSLSLWEDPSLANKVLYLPHPLAGNLGVPNKPLIPELLFSGSVNLFNWHRAFWLAAVDRLKLPIQRKVLAHTPDGLPPLESFKRYMQGLSDVTCCLNLSMRTDLNHTCVMTGRSYETILSGSLLVQESSPSMHYYFIPGEHYLEFSTLAELSAIVRFITENREEAEEIRRSGNAFAREHYNDEKIIGYIDKALYFSD